jgi:hypothetical protein
MSSMPSVVGERRQCTSLLCCADLLCKLNLGSMRSVIADRRPMLEPVA